ncbi:MAG: SGNH/GDSL hydrolase family protein [Lachnospiraceae bacterium]|nr:SGNH/GDSL hydrolase family protein [Lachnospiraceae bacterium]
MDEERRLPEWDLKQIVSNRGNRYRLRKFIRLAQVGRKLTIGFLGGSITQGSLASRPELCYAHRVYDWFVTMFPNAEFTYVNAGIGATDSQFGCARVAEDLLAAKPDLVFLEFSVNDEANAHYLETYEGLVRKIFDFETMPALVIIHNVRYDDGGNAQLIHSQVARHYGIPAVSMQSTIWQEVVSGRIPVRDITEDDLHPNDLGHEMVADVITTFLDDVWCGLSTGAGGGDDAPESARSIEPLTANGYEDSVRYQNTNANAVLIESEDFLEDFSPQDGITDIFKNGWTAGAQGAKIGFEVAGSCIAVQYRKTVQHPAPIAKAVVDGDEAHAVLLDANFEETWGDKLVIQTILEHGKPGMHSVEISICETHPGDKLPFYLVGIIASGK